MTIGKGLQWNLEYGCFQFDGELVLEKVCFSSSASSVENMVSASLLAVVVLVVVVVVDAEN